MPLTRGEARRLFSFVNEIRLRRIYFLLISVFLAHLGSGVLLGFVPTLSTQYFASTSRNERDVECVDQKEGEKPDDTCLQAHTIAVCWDAGKLFLSHLFLSIIFNALVQKYSSAYGRRPFVILALINTMLPPIVVILHLQANVPFFWFYVAKAWELSVSFPAICYLYIDDLVEEKSADMVYLTYLLTACLSCCIGLLFPAVGALNDALHAAIMSLMLIAFAAIFACLFLPESVSTSTQLNGFLAVDDGHADLGRSTFEHWVRPFQEMYDSLTLLAENKSFRSILVIYLLLELMNQRDSELEMQYLQEVAGFGTQEQSMFLMIRYLGASFVYAVLFPLWSMVLMRTYKDAFGLGILMAVVKFFGMIFVKSPWAAYVLEAFGSIDAIVSLMIFRVMDHHSHSPDARSLNSAILGIRSIAQGLSPVVHAALFALFREMFVYFPGAPFVSLFIIAFAGLMLVLNIQVTKYGFLTPSSVFLRLVTLTFYSDDEDLEDCANFPISGRGYFSEDDTNNTPSTRSENESDQGDSIQRHVRSPFG